MWSLQNCDDSATLAPGTFMLTYNGRHGSKIFSCEYSEQTHITLIGPINDRWQSAEPGEIMMCLLLYTIELSEAGLSCVGFAHTIRPHHWFLDVQVLFGCT